MKVSVITVCYNAEETIKMTIESVLFQNFSDYEYIIVDGKSIDGTNEIINSFKSDFETRGINVVHISEKDNGIYDAMNKGVKLSGGDWVCFMNSGDRFADPHVLDRVFSDDFDDYGVIYGDVISSLDGLTKEDKARDPEGLLRGMVFCHQSSFVKRELIENHPFDLKYKICADYNLFLTLYKRGVNFKKVDFPFAIFDIGGVSQTNVVEHFKEKFKIQHQFGIIDYNSKEVKFVLTKLTIRQFLKKAMPKWLFVHIKKKLFLK